jgi:hypothetical protein
MVDGTEMRIVPVVGCCINMFSLQALLTNPLRIDKVVMLIIMSNTLLKKGVDILNLFLVNVLCHISIYSSAFTPKYFTECTFIYSSFTEMSFHTVTNAVLILGEGRTE